MSHTPEPWVSVRVNASCTGTTEPYSLWVHGAGPRQVTVGKATCIHGDDMDRLVACVNACAGIQTEQLNEVLDRGLSLNLMLTQGALMAKQRDDLLAAAKYYRDECSGAEPSISVFHRMIDEAIAAIETP